MNIFFILITIFTVFLTLSAAMIITIHREISQTGEHRRLFRFVVISLILNAAELFVLAPYLVIFHRSGLH